jgi:membrane-associated phospholipid phosphatase
MKPASPARPGALPPGAKPAGRRSKSRWAWFHRSHWLEWGVVLAASGAALGIEYKAGVNRRRVDLEDRRIGYSLRTDTVPNWTLAFTIGIPMTVMGLWQIHEPSGHDAHHAVLGLAEAFAFTLLATVGLKHAVGRLRPDFLERCQPLPDGTCRGDPEDIREGRRSFPSGHTSLSFAGGTFLALYLWGKLRPFRSGGALWKILLILAPVAAAAAVGATRVTDHRHHWEDVLGGALIGAGFAVLGYRLHYPWPWSDRGGKPLLRDRWGVLATPVVGPDQVGLSAQGRF